ncbi:MAG: hypothetical protein Q4B77_07755 [Coriobacteriaceae bacterium]|nr:hypothetical protein [Coriobacteriaceae bacterium]
MPEPIVTLNEESLKPDLRELVRRTVEDTLNSLFEEEADDLVGAGRYERTESESSPIPFILHYAAAASSRFLASNSSG